MKLTEKKCPNCGASLSFGENDKSCKCEYCKREFEIERNTDNLDKINLIYHDISKGFNQGFKFIIVIYAVIFIIVAITISIISFSIFHSHEDNSSILENSTLENYFLNNINDISNFDYGFIDTNSAIAINREDINTLYFHENSSKRIVIYLLNNNNGNMLIPVYKNVYTNGTMSYELYVPVIYENVRVEHGSIAHDIGNAKVLAPKYYFNLEHSEYAIGFESIDNLYDEVLKKYENVYTITKK